LIDSYVMSDKKGKVFNISAKGIAWPADVKHKYKHNVNVEDL